MKLNILIGGKAGQGINSVSEIISGILAELGYFTFNYRDYQSLIRGGHNFNVLCVSDERAGSVESKFDIIVALDEKTIDLHKNELKKDGLIIDFKKFESEGRNLNVALAGALINILGVDKKILIDKIKKEFGEEAVKSAEKGFDSRNSRFNLERLKNKIMIKTGSSGVCNGALSSKINLFISYPMTPATGVLHELASRENDDFKVFIPENEIAAINQGLGASFTGARVMIGTSGGGFDLMTEGLSFQGQSEIPLVVYLASRPGPSTGVPTYTCQADLDIALRAGHGEFPRVVIAPGDPIECEEKTNEAFYLAEKFNALSIILSDKHLAEGEFSSDRKPNEILEIKQNRKIPGKEIVKASSYEHDEKGNTVEDSETIKKNAEARIKKYNGIKKECEKFQMIKIYGNKNAKNLIIGWGSTKTVILDVLDAIDASIKKLGNYKFLQVLYLKPLSDEIKIEIEKTQKAGGKIILVENNVTGQLGRLIREKTGISIPVQNRILKYDGRPFFADELKQKILEIR